MEKLTTQHSLYLLSPKKLREFELLYTTWEGVLDPLVVKIHNTENAQAAVLNCWVMIQSYPNIKIPDIEKNFLHRCDYYLADLLNTSPDLANIIQSLKHDADQLFIFSYYLALNFMRWIDFVLVEENAEFAATIFKCSQRRNYYLCTTQDLSPVSSKAIYLKQCLVTSLLTLDNSRFNRINQIIKHAMNVTNQHIKFKEIVHH